MDTITGELTPVGAMPGKKLGISRIHTDEKANGQQRTGVEQTAKLAALFKTGIDFWINIQTKLFTYIKYITYFLIIYTRINMPAVTRIFPLQVTRPDYVISWPGGKDAANIFGDAVGATKELFSGFSSGIQRAPGVKSPGIIRDKKGDGIK